MGGKFSIATCPAEACLFEGGFLMKRQIDADYSRCGSPLRVAFFDDRIEIEDPGIFLPGLTVAEIKQGVSQKVASALLFSLANPRTVQKTRIHDGVHDLLTDMETRIVGHVSRNHKALQSY